jgi:hypothetical protein
MKAEKAKLEQAKKAASMLTDEQKEAAKKKAMEAGRNVNLMRTFGGKRRCKRRGWRRVGLINIHIVMLFLKVERGGNKESDSLIV